MAVVRAKEKEAERQVLAIHVTTKHCTYTNERESILIITLEKEHKLYVINGRLRRRRRAMKRG